MRKKKDGSQKTKKGLVTKIVLGVLLVGGGVTALAVAPGLAMTLKLIDPNPRKAVAKLDRALRRLASDGEVEAYGRGKDAHYRITRQGRQKLARLRFGDYVLPQHKKWDGAWRIVCFDIPETEKYERTLFQQKLGDLGFYRLQNSIFVYPYPCQELIDLADQAFGFGRYVRLITAQKIDNQPQLINFFRLTK